MPVYQYQGISATGKKVRGVLDAESARALRQSLKRQGVFLTEHAEGSKSSLAQPKSGSREVHLGQLFGQRVSAMEIAVVTRQLATLLRAGIPLIEALNAIVEQVDKERFKRILSDVRSAVNEGSSLANALREHPKIFSDLYVNMVRAGESSGNLDLVLERLTEFLESQVELKGKIMSALYYPIIMSVVGLGVMGFLFIYVIPKVTLIFEQQQQALPWMTRLLIGFTAFLTNPVNAVLMLFLFGIAIYVFLRWKQTKSGRYRWDIIKLRLPFAGATLRMIAVARFTRTLGTLLASGVPVLTAMEIVKNILQNARLIEVIDEVRTNVREGESIAAPMKRSGEFDPIVTHMIAIGERSGQLEPMLHNIADSYSQQIDNRLRAFTSLLEPAMILAMGLVVGFIVFAILVPIMRIGQGIV
jgi:general secretion pathway protein F